MVDLHTVNFPPSIPLNKASQFQKSFFPFEAFSFDDPNVAASPLLSLKSPWKFAASRVGAGQLNPQYALDVYRTDVNDSSNRVVGRLYSEQTGANRAGTDILRLQASATDYYDLEGNSWNNPTGKRFGAYGDLNVIVGRANVPGGAYGNINFITPDNTPTMGIRMTIGGGTQAGQVLVTGSFKCSTAFGCNGKAAQTSYSSGSAAGAVSGTATSGGYGFASAAEFNAAITAINAIKTLTNIHQTALVANGIES